MLLCLRRWADLRIHSDVGRLSKLISESGIIRASLNRWYYWFYYDNCIFNLAIYNVNKTWDGNLFEYIFSSYLSLKSWRNSKAKKDACLFAESLLPELLFFSKLTNCHDHELFPNDGLTEWRKKSHVFILEANFKPQNALLL